MTETPFLILLVRQVVAVLSHVNKILKSRPAIQIPLRTFLDQLASPAVAESIKPFTMVYVEMGMARVAALLAAELTPAVFAAMTGR